MVWFGTARLSSIEAMEDEVSSVNALCASVALGATTCYCIMVTAVFTYFDAHRVYMEPLERVVAGMAASCLTTSFVLRMTSHLCLTLTVSPYSLVPSEGIARPKSGRPCGVLLLSHTTNLLAAFTSWLFCFTKVPILMDPFTGCRVHILRWCEWTVLSFVMSFMTEVANRITPWSAVAFAATQASSTVCGIVLPLCPGLASWSCVMSFSFGMYLTLFPRWFARRAVFVKSRQQASALRASAERERRAPEPAQRVDYSDLEARALFSYYLLTACISIWTIFVLTYFLAGAAKLSGLDERADTTWPFCVDAAVDLLAKLLYAAIIVDSHGALFDPVKLSERRLAEMRDLMSIVWVASSDALAVSVRHRVSQGHASVETSLSPTAEAMLHAMGAGADENGAEDATLGTLRFTYEDESPPARDWDGPARHDAAHHKGSAETSGFAELIRRAWRINATKGIAASSAFVHELTKTDGSKLKCEATVAWLGPNRLVVVVRDITERVARHNAEKELAVQMAARECDSSANRFTRHEVKNGLLSAIGLADAIHERQHDDATAAAAAAGIAVVEESPFSRAAVCEDSMESWVSQLQMTLTDTLKTVLSQTTARDLVHDSYTPVPELVDMVALLKPTRHQLSKFLVFESSPATLPPTLIDPQLLHFVHRNAVSNACKYGQPNGRVVTRLSLRPLPLLLEKTTALTTSSSQSQSQPRVDLVDGGDDSQQLKCVEYELTLEVVNSPGPGHAALVQMVRHVVQDKVFTQGSRLHPSLIVVPTDGAVSSVSSGDGGWIMRKCARALGGDCDIHFTPQATTFTMRCPTRQPLVGAGLGSPTSIFNTLDTTQPPLVSPAPSFEETFELPEGCWGTAIDDSKIQRKLLAKLLGYAGIADDRVSVVGDTPDEIHGFAAMVAQHVRAHPDDYHLVIVDENLDIVHPCSGARSTVSGSCAIAELRRTLLAENLEGKLLAIVRSANDSTADVAVYRDRAHGCLAKTPLKRDNVLATITPIWLERFPRAHSRA